MGKTLGKKHKKLNYKRYNEIFLNHLNLGRIFMTSTRAKKSGGEKIVLDMDKNRVWKQCYSPESLVKSQLPAQFFISNDANLVTLSGKGNSVYLRRKRFDAQGYGHYSFYIEKEDGVFIDKNIPAHALVAIVFDSDITKAAQKIIDEKGIFAFGTGLDDVNVHHKDRNITNNKPENLIIVTGKEHKMMENYPADDSPVEKECKYLEKVSGILGEEESGTPLAVVTGITYDALSGEYKEDTRQCFITDRIRFTKECVEQLHEATSTAIYRMVVESVTEQILKMEGIGFFAEAKYLLVADCFACKCEAEGTELMMQEIEVNEIPSDEECIWCYVDSEGNAVGVID